MRKISAVLLAMFIMAPAFASQENCDYSWWKKGMCPGQGEEGTNIDVSLESYNRNQNTNLSLAQAEAEAEANALAVAKGGSADNNVKIGIEGDTNKNANTNRTAVSSNDDVTITSDDDLAIAIDGDEYTTTYKAPPAFAAAGLAQTLFGPDGCTILGFDFRGSGTTQGRGATFGVPLPCGEKKLKSATKEAFVLGNYQMGWSLWCAQKAVYKGVRRHQRALGNELDNNGAIVFCYNTSKDITRITDTTIIRETVDTSEFVTQEQLTKTVTKAFIQSQKK